MSKRLKKISATQLRSFGGTRQVDDWVFDTADCLAVQRNVNGCAKGWTLLHIPTGMSMDHIVLEETKYKAAERLRGY